MLDTSQGQAREPLDRAELDALRSSVIIDERRRRPLYFDGRFLAARDLVREQSYFLTRQADLGRAGGTGVVRGLMVQRGPTTGTLRIAAGHGLTAAGEPVMLPEDLVVKLDDLPQIQRLDLSLGLLEIPREPVRNRSGVYIVALRPVEFTSNPIASYPTSVDGQRGVEDGDIVEGTVVTLIPYPDAGSGTADERRARAAYDIFVRGGTRGRPAPVLPLAMVALNLNTVEWVDPFLARREVGAEHGDVLGIGFAPRVLRESHVLQYDYHLREVLARRGTAGQRFAASEYFRALPPAGRMPAAAISADFTQIWFPATVDVDLSIVPADEIAALLEDSFKLPPIDLTRSAEELDAVAVTVLIPVPRDNFATVANMLGSLQRPLPPATPWMLARRQPIDVLRGLRLPTTLFAPESTPSNDGSWASVLAGVQVLWYARRRSLASRVDVTGVPVSLSELRQRVDEAAGGLREREKELLEKTRQPAEADVSILRTRTSFDLPPAPQVVSAPPAPDLGLSPSGEPAGEVKETAGATAPDLGGFTPAPTVSTGIFQPAPTSVFTGTVRAIDEVALSPTLTAALRDALAASTLTSAAGTTSGSTSGSTTGSTSGTTGEATLSPTLTAALADAIGTKATLDAASSTTASATQPVGEVTLSPTLTSALRDAISTTSATTALTGDVTTAASPTLSATEATLSPTLTSALRDASTSTATTSTVSAESADTTTADSPTLVSASGTPLREALAVDATLSESTAPSDTTLSASAGTLAQAVIAAVQKEEAAGKEVAVASETLLADPAFGAGLARLEEARPELATDTRAVTNLARSGVIADLDRLAASSTAAATTTKLADEVAGLAASRSRAAPTKLADAVRTRLPRGGEQ